MSLTPPEEDQLPYDEEVAQRAAEEYLEQDPRARSKAHKQEYMEALTGASEYRTGESGAQYRTRNTEYRENYGEVSAENPGCCALPMWVKNCCCLAECKICCTNADFYFRFGMLGMLPLLPAVFTHVLPICAAYCWFMVPVIICFLLGGGFMGGAKTESDGSKCSDTLERFFVRNVYRSILTCLVTATTILFFCSTIEMAVIVYGDAVKTKPISGSQYVNVFPQWFHAHGTRGYLDCLKVTVFHNFDTLMNFSAAKFFATISNFLGQF